MAYATIDDVSAELGGVSITAATAITSTMVNGWLDDAEDEVEVLSGQVYSSTAITSDAPELHDYDCSRVIMLDHYPVLSVQSLTINGVAVTDYTLYKANGALLLTSYKGVSGHQNVSVQYTHGHTSVPNLVKQLTSKIAARRYIQAVANKNAAKSSKAVSIGAINISDPSNYTQGRLSALNADIDRLQRELVGKFRVVNYDSKLYE
jgi:hypothetical protein